MNTKKLILILLVAALAGAVGVGGFLYFSDTKPPELTLTPGDGPVGKGTTFIARADDPSGLRSMKAVLVRGDKRFPLGALSTDNGKMRPVTKELTFTLDGIKGLKDGPISIEIEAVDGSLHQMGQGNAGMTSFAFSLDRKRPRISVQSMQHNLNRGGSGAISYTLNEDVKESGVRVGERFFPGHKLPSGKYACLFAFPWNMTVSDFQPTLEAEDIAGNRRVRTFAFHVNDRQFRSDVINLPDRFLNRKMPQYEDEYPDETNMLAVYLKVNSDTRKRDRAVLRELGQDTVNEPLWSGSFLRLPNSANRARFADHRTYRYKGKEVDQQTHLGIDLASLRNAKVPAANSGRVVRTGFNGIYGENVVIDHGLGLMTLYAHLSQIDVEVGDEVERGQIIGRTGATGLAGGDHLHYGVYVNGLAVQPIEWWDGTWMRNNIKDRVGH